MLACRSFVGRAGLKRKNCEKQFLPNRSKNLLLFTKKNFDSARTGGQKEKGSGEMNFCPPVRNSVSAFLRQQKHKTEFFSLHFKNKKKGGQAKNIIMKNEKNSVLFCRSKAEAVAGTLSRANRTLTQLFCVKKLCEGSVSEDKNQSTIKSHFLRFFFLL